MHKPGLEDSNIGPVRPLKRGKACLTCRFLKIKCDGVRPICGPCDRHPKDDPCEYSDGPGRSRTKALEDKISRLEARIQELEDPDRATPSMTLFNPYSDSQATGLQLTVPSTSTSPYATPDSQPYTPLSEFPLSSPPSAATSISPIGSSMMSPLPESKPILSDQEDLAQPIIRELLNNFFIHASEFGFFLNIARFHNNALLSYPLGNPARPTPALLRTVYLWGASLSSNPSQRSREADFLLRSLADTAICLTTDHPDRVMQTIQAEVLLAYYFFRGGRILEAKLHANAAAALAIGCGLHKLRSVARWSPRPIALVDKEPMYLPEPRDSLEEGERINGFWVVLTLLKTLSVAFEPAQNVCGIFETPGIQIDTPWPLDMESYKDGALPSASTGTVQQFLTHLKSEEESTPYSVAALVAKAAVLYHRAAYLAGQYSPGLSSTHMQTFYTAYEFFVRAVEDFRVSLPSPFNMDPTSPSMRMLCLTHAMTYGAMIKLHALFADTAVASRQTWLNAARAMLRFSSFDSPESPVRNVNPVMGTLLLSACEVYLDQLEKFHEMRMRGMATQQQDNGEAELSMEFQRLLEVLGNFATESALLSKSSLFRKVFSYLNTARMQSPTYSSPTYSSYSSFSDEDYADPSSFDYHHSALELKSETPILDDFEASLLGFYQGSSPHAMPIALAA